MDHISAILNKFQEISLDEMNEVRLQNREDTKYIFNINKLADVLETASGLYKILTINNLKILTYHTLYFELPDMRLYHDHHKGLRSRFKVRFREYCDTEQIYLEVKEKNNKDRTIKDRIQVDRIETKLTERSIKYIEKFVQLDASELKPSLWTNFSRLTLVNEEERERITMDMNISFKNNSDKQDLPFLTVAEVKLDRNIGQNTFTKILKSHKIFPSKMSKYGIGTALLNPALKQNRFKEKILILNKIRNDTGYYYVAN